MHAPVGAVVAHGDEAFIGLVDVDAVRVAAEVWPAAARDRGDARGRATRGGQPVELVARPEVLRHARGARALDRHDALPVGRPHRMIVERGLGREALRFGAPVRADFLDMTALIGPRDVGDPLPVGRPRRHLLVHAVGRQPPRRAPRQVHDVELVERAERQAPAVGRGARVADLLHEHVARVHAGVEPDQGPQVLVHLDREGDGRRLTRRHLDAPDLPAVRHDQRLRVGREGRARHQVAGEARLLVVALHRVDEPALVARRQVAQPQARFRVVARRIHQPLAVRREHGTHGAAVQVGLVEHLAGLPVVDGELPLRQVQVVAEAAAVAGVPQVASVGPERRAQRVVLGAPPRRPGRRPFVVFRQAHPAAAVLVIQPDLVHAADRHGRFRRDHVLPVGRPLGRGIEALFALREGARVGAVGVAQPHVLGARAVGEKHDGLAVGGIARLRVERRARGDALRLAPRRGHRVQVSQQLEHDRLSIGRHIERDPGPLRRREIDAARGLQGQRVRPLGGQGLGRKDGKNGKDGGDE